MPSKFISIVLLLCSLFYTCCRSSVNPTTPAAMKATIVNKVFFEDIPSASGLEIVGGNFYINGDDSPFLYQLDSKYKLVKRLELFDTTSFSSGRIPKSVKPDLESMTLLKFKGMDYLIALGSGSSEARNKAYVITLPDNAQEMSLPVKEVNLDALYKPLKQNKELVGDDVLNVEGMADDEDNVFLLHRAVGAGVNVLISYDLQEFAAFILEGSAAPEPSFHFFTLPKLQNFQAGFSGAFVFDKKLFFTSSVESTANAIDDGEVLGSYIGYISLDKLSSATSSTVPAKADATKILDSVEKVYKSKVESLVVKEQSNGKYKVIVVTDDDKGHSELLELEAEL